MQRGVNAMNHEVRKVNQIEKLTDREKYYRLRKGAL
jgi:hypothetical protein